MDFCRIDLLRMIRKTLSKTIIHDILSGSKAKLGELWNKEPPAVRTDFQPGSEKRGGHVPSSDQVI